MIIKNEFNLYIYKYKRRFLGRDDIVALEFSSIFVILKLNVKDVQINLNYVQRKDK